MATPKKDEMLGGEDEEELLAMCSGLASKVANLKQEKHDYVVGLFEQDERELMNHRLDAEGKAIKDKYGAKKKELASAYQQ